MGKKKLRATTLSQRFGFKDMDLYEPTHDEIILALLDKKKMAKLLVSLGLQKKFYPELECTCESRGNYPNNTCSSKERTEDHSGKCFFSFSDWETRPDLGHKHCPHHKEAFEEYILILKNLEHLDKHFSITTEWVVRNDRNYEIGFIDLMVDTDQYHEEHTFFTESRPVDRQYNTHNVYFEIKTKIDSFGATMRQINMYRPWLKGPIVLLTLDDRFNDAFKDQGILVVGSEELRRYLDD